MPTFNNAQLVAFLNIINEPARLYDVRGNLVAENLAARAVGWPDETGDNGESSPGVDSRGVIHTIDLGEGWFVRRMSVAAVPGAPIKLSGAGAVRPNLQALMSGISHEIRNPLAAILTAVGLLQDDAGLNEETVMLLDVVRKESRRMNQILTEFSLYVKPPQPQPEAFDLAQLTCETLEEMQQDGLLAPSLKIENRLPKKLMVYADPRQMQQVLRRLLGNAAEALNSQEHEASSAHGGQGSISLFCYKQEDTDHVVVCIEDNGPGLSEEETQRAFMPFYSTKPQSTGLGLSTAQVAVQAAGGAVWLENRGTPANSTSNDTMSDKGKKAALSDREMNGEHGTRACFALPCHSA